MAQNKSFSEMNHAERVYAIEYGRTMIFISLSQWNTYSPEEQSLYLKLGSKIIEDKKVVKVAPGYFTEYKNGLPVAISKNP